LTADHATIRELHENREMERLFQDLAAIGLSIDDYTLIQEESVTGEKLPSKFAWVLTGDLAKVEEKAEDEAADDESAETGVRATAQKTVTTKNAKVIEAASLPAILDSLQDLGRRGLEIKRFKGLGEMDAEQLWETTMDASKRVLLRVNWDMASNADAMFSVLMGEEVEPRRKFIEEHALEVKNLDV
jgi:DNA gyrase subunit B